MLDEQPNYEGGMILETTLRILSKYYRKQYYDEVDGILCIARKGIGILELGTCKLIDFPFG